MLVPGHVCSLYLATGGANGPALGSDEKEIVMLDYTVIDALTKEVSFFCLQTLLRIPEASANYKFVYLYCTLHKVFLWISL